MGNEAAASSGSLLQQEELGEVNPLLAVPRFLSCLRLSSNSVGDSGSIALAEALRVNHSLQSLE